MSAIVLFLIALPFTYSWFAFEFQKQVVFAALPGLAAFFAGAPVLYGRVSSLRRDLADAKEDAIDQAARMGVLHDMQIGSLLFEADFTDQGIETASLCRPSKEVGDDFFELLTLQDGRILGAVGDVMGKDVHASLVSVISKTISGSVTNRTPGPLGRPSARSHRNFCALRRATGWPTRAALSRWSRPTSTLRRARRNSPRQAQIRPSSSPKRVRSVILNSPLSRLSAGSTNQALKQVA